jgi:S1-C subfamily serine protease
MSLKRWIAVPACICLALVSSALAADERVDENVVKIYVTANEHSYHTPWQMEGKENYEGSGCIIEGRLVLTNAHVVSDQTFITVKRSGQTKKYVGAVKYVAHDCDLAVLEVKDGSFFPDVEPLEIGELPLVGDEVAVFGYPSGAEQLTVTQGIVSRVSHEYYAHSMVSLLCCQIDAPINCGSSGGPVISDGKIVGIAMMAGWGENEGFMVSVPVIRHFLEDIRDGSYDGVPSIGISYQKMENPAMRSYYKMDETHEGVLIRSVYPGSPALGKLQPEDIILAVDGVDVANDETVPFRGNERTSFLYIIQNKQNGDQVEIRYLRNGTVRTEALILTAGPASFRLVPSEQFDVDPVYFIYGGIIFSPLTENILHGFENGWYCDSVPDNLSYAAYYRELTEEQREVVVIVDVLSDEVNMGYDDMTWDIVVKANGTRVGSMADLIDAIEHNWRKYHVLETESGKKIVLDRLEADRSRKRILEQYKVPREKSSNLE